MAVVPRAAATTPIVPIAPRAYSGGAVLPVDTAKPIDPINERTALHNDEDAFQFEKFQPDFEDDARRAARRRPRRNLSSLFTLSSAGFADAFSASDKETAIRGRRQPLSTLSIRQGLEIYQTNLEVTSDDRAERGEQLSMRL